MKKSFFKRLVALALAIASVMSFATVAHASYNKMYVFNCPEDETVNLRKTANTSSTIVYRIPWGSIVSAEPYNDTWHHVKYGDYSGYMMSKYLTFDDPDTGNSYHIMYVNCGEGQTVNLRKLPQSGSTILARIPHGTSVYARYRNEDWYHVKYNGKEGFIMDEFLDYEDPDGVPSSYESQYAEYLGGADSDYNLKSGSRGTAVKNLQLMLNSIGYDAGTADGIFGTKTQTAVKEFQYEHALSNDGIVGAKTKNELWLCIGGIPDGCVKL